jgi:signal transduction histidine kinase
MSADGITMPTAPAALSSRAERAHAQKNYLAAIIALSRVIAPELCEKSRARMVRLEGFAREMLDLINLDLRSAAEAAPGSRSTVSVEGLLQGSCDLLRERAEAARVVIAIRCAGGHLDCDPARIREALSNLLANALEASTEGKTIYVDAEVGDAGEHLWTIADSGIGMPPELVRQLGTPVRSTRNGGSGVGVAIAAAIVREHGGSIHFASAIGQGTTVSIVVPAPAHPGPADGLIAVNPGKRRSHAVDGGKGPLPESAHVPSSQRVLERQR